jgi:hypothetical protein
MKSPTMRKSIDKAVMEWANERKRGFDPLTDTPRLNPNLPGTPKCAIYKHSLAELLNDARMAYELRVAENLLLGELTNRKEHPITEEVGRLQRGRLRSKVDRHAPEQNQDQED